jgi:hypothetical protein
MTGRSPVDGTVKVMRFNWPKYALAAGTPVAAVAARLLGAAPAAILGLTIVALAAAVWTVTSVAVTWWVYDHGDVYGVIADRSTGAAGGPWVAVHAGFDDATARVAAVRGRPAAVLSLRSAAGASIDRAARAHPAPGVPVRAGRLPLAPGRTARLFLSFSAHEVRDRTDRAALFAAVAAALCPGGEVVMTEHVLDTANVAAYGPGALHFRTRRSWLRFAAAAGLDLVDERRLTPFVRSFTWRR